MAVEPAAATVKIPAAMERAAKAAGARIRMAESGRRAPVEPALIITVPPAAVKMTRPPMPVIAVLQKHAPCITVIVGIPFVTP